MNYDPFKVLHVSYTADLSQVREAFKQQALIHHPDRGGNPHHFDMCKKAYHDIYTYKQQQNRQLQKENRNIQSLKQERVSSYGPSLNKGQQKQLERNFNRIFQNVRVETANDVGYGDFMEKSTKNRQDNPKLQQGKQFKNNQLVVYEEPEPLPSLNQNYEILGEEKIKDFGKRTTSGLQYTDYMVAHSEQEGMDKKPHERLSSLDNVKQRKSYKTVDQLQARRSNISYQMSPQNLEKYQKSQK